MRKHTTLPFLSSIFKPTQVFIALLIAVIIWLYPAITQPVLSNTEKTRKPLQEYGGVSLVSAIEAHAPNCDRSCQNEVCVSWIPGPSPRCPRPGPGGGCCTTYETQCDPGCSDPTPTLPPTIAATLSCSQNGINNWCIGSLSLNLAGSDPQGQPIIISGTLNGTPFACPQGAATCSIPVSSEGTGTINYRVDSATSLSASGSTTYQLDLSTPQLDGNLSGANGTTGWFISDVIFSASAVDTVSGLAALETSTDGGAWSAYNAPITLSDGVHTVALRAYDYAGNLAETNQTISIDTLTPVLDSSVSGAVGLNGWYVSDAQVSATASDLGSGIFMLEVSTDGGAWTSYSAPITLSDGVHTVQFRATDNAGNITESAQTVKVDTITPTLNLSVSGTVGLNGWRTSITQVSSTSSDSGSGVAIIEGVTDSGVWAPVNSLSFSDGLHTYQFKATDNAGNTTTIPVQNLKVDTISPVIDMTGTLPLGEKVFYSLEDYGSGLSIYRAVIEDDAEKYKKIVWLDNISGNKLEDDILWDGKFADGTKAAWGEYFITLKISDAAGNETMKTAVVKVNLLNALQIIPTFTLPQASLEAEPAPSAQTESTLPTGFGGMNNGATGEITSSSFASAGGVRAEGGAVNTHTWTKAPGSAAPAIPQSAILWGVAATALVGATLADWKRKRDEEERRAREENQSDGPSSYRKIAKAYQASLNNFRAMLKKAMNGGNVSEKDVKHYINAAKTSGNIGVQLAAMKQQVNQAGLAKKDEARKAGEEEARKAAEAEEKRKAEELQAGLAAYYTGRKAGEIAVTPPKEKKKSVWEKAWDWTYKYQTELSLGTGVLVGAAAVVAGVIITAPALLVVGGAVLVTAALVTVGTVVLNAHFGLGLGNNLGENLVAGIAATVITSGAGLLLANFAPLIGTTIATTCTNYATACTQVGTIIDKGEEALLAGQISYYNLIGDQDNAAQATIELQLELMDGDAPGNTVAKELGEQIAKLGPDALEIVEKYGDDAIPYLIKYGDDAVEIIGEYGYKGIALLSKYGDDTWEAINLVKQYGTPAVKVLDAVDLTSAQKLLTAMDNSAIDLEYAITLGPDAVRALSYWPDDFLVKYGDELVLRARDDARALEAASKLVRMKDLSTKEARDLIDTIANNSIQGDGSRLVLGKWVNDGTLDNGFIGIARADGALFYGTNPGLDKILSESTDLPQEDLFWAVNNRVLEISVAHDFKIDYSLDGIDSDNIRNEVNAISAIASGKSRAEVAEYFGGKFPFRMREVEVLISHGYKFDVDAAGSMIHWIKP